MQQNLKDKLPSWYNDIDGKGAVITGDTDALIGLYFLQKKFDIKVTGFYDFKRFYKTKEFGNSHSFGIDLDTVRGTTFGNHLTHFYKNKNAINLNNYIGHIKYYQKYPFSTVLLILSLYDFDLESFTDEQLKIILCIDSAFTGYYTNKQFFKDVYLTWLDRLGIRFLEDRILKHMTKMDFAEIKNKYKLNGIINVDENGYLQTNINLDKLSDVFDDIIALPTDNFKLHKTYEYVVINPQTQSIPNKENIMSMAWTYKSELKLTLKK